MWLWSRCSQSLARLLRVAAGDVCAACRDIRRSVQSCGRHRSLVSPLASPPRTPSGQSSWPCDSSCPPVPRASASLLRSSSERATAPPGRRGRDGAAGVTSLVQDESSRLKAGDERSWPLAFSRLRDARARGFRGRPEVRGRCVTACRAAASIGRASAHGQAVRVAGACCSRAVFGPFCHLCGPPAQVAHALVGGRRALQVTVPTRVEAALWLPKPATE